jgi:hypothetical protein
MRTSSSALVRIVIGKSSFQWFGKWGLGELARRGDLDSIEQAFFGHRAGQPDCIKVSDDFAGLDVVQLRVIDLIASNEGPAPGDGRKRG